MSIFGKLPMLADTDLNRLVAEYRSQYADELEPEELEKNLNEDLDMSDYWMQRGKAAAEKQAWGRWGPGNGPIRQMFRGGGGTQPMRPQQPMQTPQAPQAPQAMTPPPTAQAPKPGGLQGLFNYQPNQAAPGLAKAGADYLLDIINTTIVGR